MLQKFLGGDAQLFCEVMVEKESSHGASAGIAGTDKKMEGGRPSQDLLRGFGPGSEDTNGAALGDFDNRRRDPSFTGACIEDKGGGIQDPRINLFPSAGGRFSGKICTAHDEALGKALEKGSRNGVVYDPKAQGGERSSFFPFSDHLCQGILGGLIQYEGEGAGPKVLREALGLDGSIPKAPDLLGITEMESKGAMFALELSQKSHSLWAIEAGRNPINRLCGEDHQVSPVQGLFEEGR